MNKSNYILSLDPHIAKINPLLFFNFARTFRKLKTNDGFSISFLVNL